MTATSLAPVALYVHVPFCVSLCPYCDFVVYAGSAARGPASRVDAFTDALLTELRLRADAADAAFGRAGTAGRAQLETVYLGGGTPTLLPATSIAAILDLTRARFGIANDAEVTIESNPGPDERGDALGLVEAGVNRLSLGAQSFEPALLRRLGRRHRPGHVEDAVGEARAAGVASISLDLLYDVPGQDEAAWDRTLDAAIDLGVDHVSAYALTLDDPDAEGLTGPLGDHLPTRAGARRWRVDAVRGQDEDVAAGQYANAVSRLAAAGFRGYEISNWGRPGHESRHNLVYWRRRPYEAVGPGAHAFDGATRRWNAARLDRYLHALAPADGSAPALPPGASETPDAAAADAEAVILALRLDTGLPLTTAKAGPLAPHLEWALESGLLEPVGGPGERRVRLTTHGRLLSNELFARLV
ncbi:MAG TPA: radical SAM family heme chaperone HemW [Candidatus Limnocylindrales bacterium]